MKRHHQNLREFMDRTFARSRNLPPASVDPAWQRVLERMREEPDDESGWAPAAAGSVRPFWSSSRFVIAAVIVLAVFALMLFRNSGAPAVLESANGARNIPFGELLRSDGAGGAVLTLKDGSHVEMRSKSELALEAVEDGVRIRLNAGSVIVTAAKQGNGHLYVQTRDLTASVVGTVFVVNAEESGSRVAVIQGEVRVEQGVTSTKLLPGQQVATNPLMEPQPLSREVSWSSHAEKHLELLQQAVAPTATAPKRLEFEAAFIKPEPPAGAESGVMLLPRCQGVDGVLELRDAVAELVRGLDPGMANLPARPPSAAPKGRCIGRRATLADLIGLAYDVDVNLMRPSITGGPQWAYDTRDGFEIEAKADHPENATRGQLQQMLQALLADWFKLKLSWQTREFQGYVLYPGNGGAKLPAASSEEALKQITRNVGEAVQRVITGNASMKAFADFISHRPPLMAGGPGPDRIDAVLDRTELKGLYSFNLVYTVPPMATVGGDSGQRGGGGDSAGGYSPAFLSMRDALQMQLGLRLESARIPTEFPVIEHVEKPTEN